MVKEVPVSITITGCTAQDYYKAIYAQADAFQSYHKEYSKDPQAICSGWDGGQRTVSFKMALNIPAMLKKVIGTECVEVSESQCITWHDDDKFSVESVPNLNFPGSNKFVTKGHTTVSTVNGDTCQVSATIICSAMMPWPMQGTVEAAMATEAQAGVSKFLNFAMAYCIKYKAQQQAPAGVDAMPALVAQMPAIADEYYDAEDFGEVETAEQLNNQVGEQAPRTPPSSAGGVGRGVPGQALTNRAVMAEQGTQQLVPGGQDADRLVRVMRELQQTNQTMAVSLADVVAQLRAVNEQLSAIRTALGAGNKAAGMLANGHAQGSYQASQVAPSLGVPTGWWLAGLACASAVGLVVVRSQHQRATH